MVGKDRPGGRIHRSKLGVAGAGIALVALVLIPSATVAGLMVGIPPGSGRPSIPVGGGGVSVTISVRYVCLFPLFEGRADVCAVMPSTLMFAATLSGGANASLYVWSFGDGSVPGLGQAVQHTFPSCALYTVSVAAFAGGGSVANSTIVYPCAA